MRIRRLLAPIAAHAVALALVPALVAPAHAEPSAAAEWNDGTHDEDTVVDCITRLPSTGVSANVGWRSADGQVPEVGETFHLRGYLGLVSLPCSGKVAVLPEVMVPRGVDFADGPVLWDLTPAGEEPDLQPDDLAFDQGANGGILIGNPDYSPFTLRQGDILEFQFPVVATRELRGPATQRPECQDRRDGTRPCPIDQSGDHVQLAFTVGGHGGDKSYVTPYVGLFAARPGPVDPAPTTKATSRTTAAYAVSRRKQGRATVTVRSSRTPTGRVVVRDRGREIARATLAARAAGRVVVRLPRLRPGVHKLSVRYAGSATVRPSASPVRTVRVR